MPEFRLHTGNRMEVLADKLAGILKKPLSSPFKEETIVVQSRGMMRWISLEIARRQGIWSNGKFLLPNMLVQELYDTVLPGESSVRFIDTDLITWKIMKILSESDDYEGFESIRSYLSGDLISLKCLQLSARIASLFDQYLTFRPDMIIRWDRGEDDQWQARMWRKLTEDIEERNPAVLKSEFIKTAGNLEPGDLQGLPERISVFGISYLPPFHVEVLSAISRIIEVNIFLLSPTREYWADIKSGREISGIIRRGQGDRLTIDDQHIEKGNSLLASLGKTGRDFFKIITSIEDIDFCFEYKEPGNDTLLQCIQSDILQMLDRGAPGEENCKKIELREETMAMDNSICINSCHSKMREIEVLQNYILDLFNSDPSLKPRDILVIATDIEAYAPYINAVFNSTDDSHHIPYTISDKSIIGESHLIALFSSVLELSGTRFCSSSILGILESEYVHGRFGLVRPDLEMISGWVKALNIRWGYDAEDRIKSGMPGINENSWKWGIDRLMLGFAMAGTNEKLFNGLLPFTGVEGSQVEVLGKFIHFIETLYSIMERCRGKLTLHGWGKLFSQVIDELFVYDEKNETEIQSLRSITSKLDTIENVTGFEAKIDLSMIKAYIRRLFDEPVKKGKFITGGVTFCSSLPMRSIPFKAICMVGMDNGIFPRISRPVSFDLIADKPRTGDRSVKDEDRYLFLESIVSAREKMYLSYIGQSIQDNSEIPPSVVITELLDYILQGYFVKGRDIRDFILYRHRLQNFSPGYFREGSRLYSYSEENYSACISSLKNKRPQEKFLHGSLKTGPVKENEIIPDELIHYFFNPSRYFLKNMLGILYYNIDEKNEDNEPFHISGLNRYHIEQKLLDLCMRDLPLDDIYGSISATGLLPHGRTGEYMLFDIIENIKNFIRRVREIKGENILRYYEADLELGIRIRGDIDNIGISAHVEYRYARISAKDKIRLWINHLILNSDKTGEVPGRSIFIGRGEEFVLNPVNDACEILKKLIAYYLTGRNQPVPFFPESSLKFSEVLARGKTESEALADSLSVLRGDDFKMGELQNPYFSRCFRNIDSMPEDFSRVARDVYDKMLLSSD